MRDGSDGEDNKERPARPVGSNYTPVLGLFSSDEPRPAPAILPSAEPKPLAPLELSVILPARDEQDNLGACLETLAAQHETIFALGTDWEILVVDDDSTDRTRAIADEFAAKYPGIKVLTAPPLELRGAQRAFTGKTNACWAGAQVSQGRWLLFTDADTRHEAGDLRRALHEAHRNGVALLSYSPRQIVTGIAQRLVMPLIFSELASVYKPEKVNDPADRTAAANGQFLLVEREAYFAAGGHKAVGRSVLEDVDLAFNIKRSKKAIRLRFAPDALSTHMYRGFGDMVEGWTKNLALLFPHSLRLVLWRFLDLLLLLLPLLIWLLPYLVTWQRVAIVALWARTLLRFYQRVARAHFPFLDSALAPLGLPLFLYLLLASYIRHRVLHTVTWKGREYRT
ncbi:MAG TPA: glycosyltransferase family 2 protein [Acidobacteriaceae bacterium]|nr:glycosyltransferase family 2 protein [Acidobacteriaceae bacterium]